MCCFLGIGFFFKTEVCVQDLRGTITLIKVPFCYIVKYYFCFCLCYKSHDVWWNWNQKKEETSLCCKLFIHALLLIIMVISPSSTEGTKAILQYIYTDIFIKIGCNTNVLTTFMTKSVSGATGLLTSCEARWQQETMRKSETKCRLHSCDKLC